MEDTRTNKVLVNVILDRSGSMAHGRAETISGYNEYLNGLRADKETEFSVSLIQFDGTATDAQLTVSYLDKPLAEVSDLTEADYQPRGNTPLYDAVGESCRRIEAKGRVVIAVIITDGYENASIEFTKYSIRALIAKKEGEGWTFVFMGCNIDSYAESGSIGIASANVSNFSPQHVHTMYDNVASSTVARAASIRSVGLRAANATPYFSMEQRVAMGDDTLPSGTQTFTNPVTPNVGGARITTTFRPGTTFAGGTIATPIKPCCERDHDKDGNCDVHKATAAPPVAKGKKPRKWETAAR